ncbi:MAG: AAA15 family ATPase/GTPase [Crocinitomicaceae bacterium]|jgi:AAA15 family ATPase/GTPase
MKILRHLELSGYKSIKNVQLDLFPGINILIGQNGSGKSNLLNFIKLLEEDVLDLDSDYKVLVEWSSGDDIYKKELEQVHSTAGTSIFANLDMDIAALKSRKEIKGKISKNKSIVFESSVIGVNKYKANLTNEVENNDELELNFSIELIDFYNKKQMPFLSNPADSELSYDGAIGVFSLNIPFGPSLAFTLGTMSEAGGFSRDIVHDHFSIYLRALLNFVKEYSPVQDVRLKDIFKISEGSEIKTIENVQLEFLVSDSWYKWDQLSDGTRRILTIIDSVYHATDIILIEEPELGIHPHQLSQLLDFLAEMSEKKQIIISTHSPDVLDSIGIDSLEKINIVEMNSGQTTVHKLTDEQKEKAKIYYDETGTIGDYWKHSDLEI